MLVTTATHSSPPGRSTVSRKVQVGRHVVDVKPIILGAEIGDRFPCCGDQARLAPGARQRVQCTACGFPWRVIRKKKGFDWSPDHSAMGRGLPDGMSRQEADALLDLVAALIPPGRKLGRRRR